MSIRNVARTEINQVQRFVLMEKCLCLSSKPVPCTLICTVCSLFKFCMEPLLTFKVNSNSEYLHVLHTNNFNDKQMVPK